MSLIRRISVFALLSAALVMPLPSFAVNESEKISAASDANTNFTPLLLPEDAKQSGISLSGEAKMYRTEPGKYQLGCGCVLVHTEEPIFVTTCRTKVFAKAGATIVIGAKKDATRVLNLSDRKHDSVRVLFGKNHISLNPGEEIAVIGANAASDDKAANEYVIRYRNAQSLAPSPDYKALLFEFSLADALKHCLIFKQLRESPRKEDQVLLKEIIKTAAAVNSMFAKNSYQPNGNGLSKPREQYSHGQNAQQVAAKEKAKKVAEKKRTAKLASSGGFE